MITKEDREKILGYEETTALLNCGSMRKWDSKVNEKGIPCIQLIYHGSSYKESVKMLNEVAYLCDSNNHHPDLNLNYRKLTVQLWTHTKRGITLADIKMAKELSSSLKGL
jgi:4a-hydroxytetrahydrobiopterin dehydratase